MKKPYNPKDNDTFDELYSHSPVADMEIHMFKGEGKMHLRHTLLGNISGGFHSETSNIANDYVLQFPEAKQLGLKVVKYKDLDSLYPQSLINRYKLGLTNFVHRQKTPIFFDTEKEQFVLALDKRFFRDLSNEEVNKFKESLKEPIHNGQIKFQNKTKESDSNLLLYYDSLDELYKDKSNLIKKVHIQYRALLMHKYPLEDVIVVQYAIARNRNSYLKKNGFSIIGHHSTKENGLTSTKVEFDFLKAKKFSENHYFFYEKDGALNLNKAVHFDKERERQEAEKYRSLGKYDFGDKPKTLIMPYTKVTWDKLNTMKNNLTSILNELGSLLNTQKQTNALDGSLTDIQYAIEDKRLLHLTDDRKDKAPKI